MGKTKPPKGTKTPKSAPKPQPGTNGVPAAPAGAENLTLAEAAAWLRVAEEGLRADAVAGRVPARQVAGDWRFNKAALIEWLSQPEVPENRPKSGAELAARIREINPGPTYADNPEAVEREIAELYKLRKTMWSAE